MRSESEVQQLIQLAGPRHDCLLMRNNSGALKDIEGRLVRYGLGNISRQQNERTKSSDLIGITTITITPDMVGKEIGVFTAVEVKAEGWKPNEKDKRYLAQKNFLNWVRLKGGFAMFAQSEEEFKIRLKTMKT